LFPVSPGEGTGGPITGDTLRNKKNMHKGKHTYFGQDNYNKAEMAFLTVLNSRGYDLQVDG